MSPPGIEPADATAIENLLTLNGYTRTWWPPPSNCWIVHHGDEIKHTFYMPKDSSLTEWIDSIAWYEGHRTNDPGSKRYNK